jgi:Fur family ferric uptake transcriptional regulator
VPDPAGDQPPDWRSRLRERGYRLTAQRELVLAAVEELRHATPDEVHAHVHEKAPHLNLSTVYRNLEVLEELGLVKHAHLTDRSPTYHAVGGHEHFHLVCRNCRKVTSVGVETARALTDELEAEHGFRADVGHLTVFGRCVECEDAEPDHGHHA